MYSRMYRRSFMSRVTSHASFFHIIRQRHPPHPGSVLTRPQPHAVLAGREIVRPSPYPLPAQVVGVVAEDAFVAVIDRFVP